MLPKERQALEDMLEEAQTVLQKAHGKGVELECILEVNTTYLLYLLITLFQYIIMIIFLQSAFEIEYFLIHLLMFSHGQLYLFFSRLGANWYRITRF